MEIHTACIIEVTTVNAAQWWRRAHTGRRALRQASNDNIRHTAAEQHPTIAAGWKTAIRLEELYAYGCDVVR